MNETIVICVAWITTSVAVVVAHFKSVNPTFPLWAFAFPLWVTLKAMG